MRWVHSVAFKGSFQVWNSPSSNAKSAQGQGSWHAVHTTQGSHNQTYLRSWARERGVHSSNQRWGWQGQARFAGAQSWSARETELHSLDNWQPLKASQREVTRPDVHFKESKPTASLRTETSGKTSEKITAQTKGGDEVWTKAGRARRRLTQRGSSSGVGSRAEEKVEGQSRFLAWTKYIHQDKKTKRDRKKLVQKDGFWLTWVEVTVGYLYGNV